MTTERLPSNLLGWRCDIPPTKIPSPETAKKGNVIDELDKHRFRGSMAMHCMAAKNGLRYPAMGYGCAAQLPQQFWLLQRSYTYCDLCCFSASVSAWPVQ
ncbi:unnamed protein product [Durusdinium trenchii]|uniref:Uncharacterized protein n=1 Tax=Durusdinium trenchii TaxID=1381693 RepID=A0ABP0HS40_9DINO